jgi:hypothetical protein
MGNFVPRCLGCKQIIVDTYIQALGGHYHKNCFVCQVNINKLLRLDICAFLHILSNVALHSDPSGSRMNVSNQ